MLFAVKALVVISIFGWSAAQAQTPDARSPAPKRSQIPPGCCKAAAPPAPGTTFRAVCDTAGGSCSIRDSSPIPSGSTCSCGGFEGATR